MLQRALVSLGELENFFFLFIFPFLLENTKRPNTPANVDHEYTDKYLLAEWMTLATMATTLTTLEVFGIDSALFEKMLKMVETKSVTIRLAAVEHCEFDRHEKRKLDSGKHTSEGFGRIWEHKVVHKIDEWFWKFDYNYQVSGGEKLFFSFFFVFFPFFFFSIRCQSFRVHMTKRPK
jgi:hypothetical protein